LFDVQFNPTSQWYLVYAEDLCERLTAHYSEKEK